MPEIPPSTLLVFRAWHVLVDVLSWNLGVVNLTALSGAVYVKHKLRH